MVDGEKEKKRRERWRCKENVTEQSVTAELKCKKRPSLVTFFPKINLSFSVVFFNEGPLQ